MLGLSGQLGAFALARAATRRHLRILAYHGLWTTPGMPFGDKLFMSAEQFEARMRWLKRSPYPVIGLGDAVEMLADGSLPSHAVVITIDDGWTSTYTHMLPVLEALQLPATLYVTTWHVDNRAPVFRKAAEYVLLRAHPRTVRWSGLELDTSSAKLRERGAAAVGAALQRLATLDARIAAFKELCAAAAVPTEPWWSAGQFHLMTREQIADASRRGLDIQFHTHRHIGNDVAQLPAEIEDNRRVLSACVAAAGLKHFCYPSGGYDQRAPQLLAAAGIRSATLCQQGLNPPGTDPYHLKRFLDGRSVSPAAFEFFLSGASDLLHNASSRITGRALRSRLKGKRRPRPNPPLLAAQETVGRRQAFAPEVAGVAVDAAEDAGGSGSVARGGAALTRVD